MKMLASLLLMLWVSSLPVGAAASGVSPDVLGIKVGVSSVAEVKAALKSVTPALDIVEERMLTLAGRGMGSVPGGKYVSDLRALTLESSRLMQTGSSQTVNCRGAWPNGFCESLWVSFTAPPDAGIAIRVRRVLLFEAGPSVDNMIRSLSEKYGKPSIVDNYRGLGKSYTLLWIWQDDGALLPLKSLDHPCAREPVVDAHKGADTMVQNGCAAVVHVRLAAGNGVVTSATVVAANTARANEAALKTAKFVEQAVGQFQSQEREKADRTSTPEL